MATMQRSNEESAKAILLGGQEIQHAIEHFHSVYKQPIQRTTQFPSSERVRLRLALIREEWNELQDAVADREMVGTADALGDLIYVIFGMAIELGIPMGGVLRTIQRSNMSKLGTDDQPIYRDDGKIMKGPNFQEPDIQFVLRSMGQWEG